MISQFLFTLAMASIGQAYPSPTAAILDATQNGMRNYIDNVRNEYIHRTQADYQAVTKMQGLFGGLGGWPADSPPPTVITIESLEVKTVVKVPSGPNLRKDLYKGSGTVSLKWITNVPSLQWGTWEGIFCIEHGTHIDRNMVTIKLITLSSTVIAQELSVASQNPCANLSPNFCGIFTGWTM